MNMKPPVTVVRTQHGPFERLVLSHPSPGTLPAQLSVYRVGDLLIDTGGTIVADTLAAALADRPPRRILLTHQHEDHAGGVATLRRAFGALPVLCPRAHVGIVTTGVTVPDFRAAYWGQPEPTGDVIPFDPGHVVEDNDVLLEALLTPGHTPGHITWLARTSDGARFALSGDLFLSERPLPAWHESAADDLVASQRQLAALAPDLTLLPTHGRVRTDGAATLLRSADAAQREADAVHAAAAALGTRDPTTVARALYGELDAFERHVRGEISRLAWARAVLAPVRTLPAPALVFD